MSLPFRVYDVKGTVMDIRSHRIKGGKRPWNDTRHKKVFSCAAWDLKRFFYWGLCNTGFLVVGSLKCKKTALLHCSLVIFIAFFLF